MSKLSLSPKMMEQLKKDEALQIKGGRKSTSDDTNYVCHTNVPCKKKLSSVK